MTEEFAKQELIKRYKYLYKNAQFILAPYMYEQTNEEYLISKREYKQRFNEELSSPIISLKFYLDSPLIPALEEFLLSDIPLENSTLYQTLEKEKNNQEYLDKVKRGLALVDKKNQDVDFEPFILKLDLYKLFGTVSDYLEEQSGDLNNKKNKLLVLDEYYRILRYQNNGKTYISGRNLSIHDCNSLIIPLNKHIPSRDKSDIGVTKNSFITRIINIPRNEDNNSILTENEKQAIYLEFHDELPWDLEIDCSQNKMIISASLYNLGNTIPCGKSFLIKESEIFINPIENIYRYYQLCPHCGYIVNIPKEILSDGIKEKIEKRCQEDNNLFKKMYLYSQLCYLDRLSNDNQKRLIKK